jgi:hypothetical protein
MQDHGAGTAFSANQDFLLAVLDERAEPQDAYLCSPSVLHHRISAGSYLALHQCHRTCIFVACFDRVIHRRDDEHSEEDDAAPIHRAQQYRRCQRPENENHNDNTKRKAAILMAKPYLPRDHHRGGRGAPYKRRQMRQPMVTS